MHRANATIERDGRTLLLEVYFEIGPADRSVGIWGWSCEPVFAEVCIHGNWVQIDLIAAEWQDVVDQIERLYEY